MNIGDRVVISDENSPYYGAYGYIQDYSQTKHGWSYLINLDSYGSHWFWYSQLSLV